MAKVEFRPLKTVEVEAHETLFEAAQRCAIPIASSCNAKLVCGKCRVQVLEGHETLEPASEAELKLLQREKAASNERLSCQVRVTKPCVVTTKYW